MKVGENSQGFFGQVLSYIVFFEIIKKLWAIVGGNSNFAQSE